MQTCAALGFQLLARCLAETKCWFGEQRKKRREGRKGGILFLEVQKSPHCLRPEIVSMFLSMAKGEKM